MSMIVYTPFWETMKRRGYSTYTLRAKYQVSGSTIQRLRKGLSISTNTLDDLCKILNCDISDLIAFVPDGDYVVTDYDF